MSREKLLSVVPRSKHAKRLQQLMLEYHEFRLQRDAHPLADLLDGIGEWQINRLKTTHLHLYEEPRYHQALQFLLEDLYAPKRFIQRDADLERIFPKIVKLVPENALGTVANLVELNLLTQKLDEHLATLLRTAITSTSFEEIQYVQAFRACDNLAARKRQLQLIRITGLELERYVDSRLLAFSLAITETPAELAGLGQLHGFIRQGFSAFKTMGGVAELLDQVIQVEERLAEQIFAGELTTYGLQNNAGSSGQAH